MTQSHVLRAESLKEALEWCKFFANTPLPKQENAIIVTNGGGIGVLATDACEKYGVKLYDNYETLKETYSEMIPYFGSTKNPVDLTGQATSIHYQSAFQASLDSPDIHSLIALYCETAVFDIENFSPIMEENYRKFKEARKPIVFCLVGGKQTEDCVNDLRKRDVPVYTDPYEAVSSLGAMYTYVNFLREPSGDIDEAPIDLPRIEEIAKKVREDKRRFLLPAEARGLMEAVGIPMPKSLMLTILRKRSPVRKTSVTVVMKIVSKDILHKVMSGCGARSPEQERGD
jgi:acyl-CoA synthetase (NDP forming)